MKAKAIYKSTFNTIIGIANTSKKPMNFFHSEDALRCQGDYAGAQVQVLHAPGPISITVFQFTGQYSGSLHCKLKIHGSK